MSTETTCEFGLTTQQNYKLILMISKASALVFFFISETKNIKIASQFLFKLATWYGILYWNVVPKSVYTGNLVKHIVLNLVPKSVYIGHFVQHIILKICPKFVYIANLIHKFVMKSSPKIHLYWQLFMAYCIEILSQNLFNWQLDTA